MCDDLTEAENERFLATKPREKTLGRRELGVGASATVAIALAGCGSSEPSPQLPEPTPTGDVPAPAPLPAAEAKTLKRDVTVKTPDGEADAFFVAPKEGKHPGVLMWPDVAGMRDAYRKMATRLAEAGYAVLAVNCYYRSSKLPIMEVFEEWRTDEGKAKIAPMRELLTAEAVSTDGAAFVAFLDEQPEVDTSKKVGTAGYCMSGPFTFRTAAAASDRVGVIASFHGGGLATEEADSPHTLLAKMKAAALICIAQNDDERDPDAKDKLRKAADDAGRTAEIEVYPAMHGWCTIDSPVYDEEQAEKAWARMLAMLEAHL